MSPEKELEPDTDSPTNLKKPENTTRLPNTMTSSQTAPHSFPIDATWDFTSLGIEDVSDEVARLERMVTHFEQWRAVLNEDTPPLRFEAILQEFDTLSGDINRLHCRVNLPVCANSRDEQASALSASIANTIADFSKRILFFELSFQKMSDKKAAELIVVSTKHSYYLTNLRKNIPHTLSEAQESILAAINPNGIDALLKVGATIRSKMEFEFEGRKITRPEVRQYFQSNDRAIREVAYETYHAGYEPVKDELMQIYTARVLDWRTNKIGLRNFRSPISVTNHANDLPDEAIESLLSVCRANQSLMQRFFEAKRVRLGLANFERHDVHAPVAATNVHISHQEGSEMVLAAYQEFSPIFANIARSVMISGHIDAAPRKGKRGGAFCSGAGLTSLPYIMENYTGTVNDVFTKVHELGHGIHNVLARVQTELTWHPGLPIAETAATFGELLLGGYLERERPDLTEYLLFNEISDFYSTVIRQASFGEFEIIAHEMIANGASISELNARYLADLRLQFGSNVIVPEHFALEWLTIPHFVNSPFYVPAYAFGQLFSLALYQEYLAEGSSFAPKVVELLSLGGSIAPAELCLKVGFDVKNANHWQRGFDFIASRVTALEARVS